MFGRGSKEHRKEDDALQIRALNSEEVLVIDALHFLLSFAELSRETGLPGQVLKECLTRLIADGFVAGMAWNEKKKDFIPAVKTNPSLEGCSFMATKEGLRAYYYSA